MKFILIALLFATLIVVEAAPQRHSSRRSRRIDQSRSRNIWSARMPYDFRVSNEMAPKTALPKPNDQTAKADTPGNSKITRPSAGNPTSSGSTNSGTNASTVENQVPIPMSTTTTTGQIPSSAERLPILPGPQIITIDETTDI